MDLPDPPSPYILMPFNVGAGTPVVQDSFETGQCIVFVWSRCDGGNIEQRAIGMVGAKIKTKTKYCGRSNTSIQPTM